MALFAATAAASSSKEIKALISSISVNFHVNGESSSMSDTGITVLNYQGHLYVPLRSFAEKMSGAVYYKPPVSGDGAKVDVYYEDDRNLPLADKDGYVRVGYTNVHLSNSADISSINGTLKLLQNIPQNKEIVFAILDEKGRDVSTSGPLWLTDAKLSQLGKGAIIPFSAQFPYRDYPDNYRVEVRVADKMDWTFMQYPSEAAVSGAGGVNGFPLALRMMGGSGSSGGGAPYLIGVELLNLDEDETYTISKPVAFDIEINKVEGDKTTLVRTVKTKPFAGVVEWKKGAVRTIVPWDGKDGNGKPVPRGEYQFVIKTPVTAEGFANGSPNLSMTFTLEWSMQLYSGVIIK